MSSYYVEDVALFNGDHEVHVAGCHHLPEKSHRIYLGEFTNCSPAIQQAREIYPSSNGCFSCCEYCHGVYSLKH